MQLTIYMQERFDLWVQVRDEPGGEWRTVKLSSAIKALVVLNLQVSHGSMAASACHSISRNPERGERERDGETDRDAGGGDGGRQVCTAPCRSPMLFMNE